MPLCIRPAVRQLVVYSQRLLSPWTSSLSRNLTTYHSADRIHSIGIAMNPMSASAFRIGAGLISHPALCKGIRLGYALPTPSGRQIVTTAAKRASVGKGAVDDVQQLPVPEQPPVPSTSTARKSRTRQPKDIPPASSAAAPVSTESATDAAPPAPPRRRATRRTASSSSTAEQSPTPSTPAPEQPAPTRRRRGQPESTFEQARTASAPMPEQAASSTPTSHSLTQHSLDGSPAAATGAAADTGSQLVTAATQQATSQGAQGSVVPSVALTVAVGDEVRGVVAAVRDGYLIVELPSLGRGVTAVLDAARAGLPGFTASQLRASFPVDSPLQAVVASTSGPTLELTSAKPLQPTPAPAAAIPTAEVAAPSPPHPEPSAAAADGAVSKKRFKIAGRGSLFGRKSSEAKTTVAEPGWSSPAPAAASSSTALAGMLAETGDSLADGASGIASDISRCSAWADLKQLITNCKEELDSTALMALTKRVTRLLAVQAQNAAQKDKGGAVAEDMTVARDVLHLWAQEATRQLPGFVVPNLSAVLLPALVARDLKILGGRKGQEEDEVSALVISALSLAKDSGNLRSFGPSDLTLVLKTAAALASGKLDTDMLSELELASYAQLEKLSGEQLADVIEALEKLGKPKKWAPNQVWLERFLELTGPKIVALSPKALASTLKALATFDAKPPKDWMDRWNQAFQKHTRDMSPTDLSNALMGMAKLGVGFGGGDGQAAGKRSGGGMGMMDMDMDMPDFGDMDDFDMDMPDFGNDAMAGFDKGGMGGFGKGDLRSSDLDSFGKGDTGGYSKGEPDFDIDADFDDLDDWKSGEPSQNDPLQKRGQPRAGAESPGLPNGKPPANA